MQKMSIFPVVNTTETTETGTANRSEAGGSEGIEESDNTAAFVLTGIAGVVLLMAAVALIVVIAKNRAKNT